MSAVYGTESTSPQTVIPKEDTTPAGAARSAYDSAQAAKLRANMRYDAK